MSLPNNAIKFILTNCYTYTNGTLWTRPRISEILLGATIVKILLTEIYVEKLITITVGLLILGYSVELYTVYSAILNWYLRNPERVGFKELLITRFLSCCRQNANVISLSHQ